MSFLRGLDVSSCQGTIDWDKVPAEFRYVFVKVTEGATGIDPTHARNIAEARRTGRYAFVYHFFRTSQDAAAQAKNLIANMGDTATIVMLDFESLADGMTPAAAIAKAVEFIRAIKCELGRAPAFYTFPWFEQHVLGASIAQCHDIAECPLVMADYSGGEYPPDGWHPVVPQPWSGWCFAQTSGNNSSFVAGIPGHVDHDIFNGDETAMRQFLGLPDVSPSDPTIPFARPSIPVVIVDDSPDEDPPPQAA